MLHQNEYSFVVSDKEIRGTLGEASKKATRKVQGISFTFSTLGNGSSVVFTTLVTEQEKPHEGSPISTVL
ncbi:MAG: hypothetical protein ACK4WD_05715 [Flavobacteriales bacterium]|jgi:hypothetical protein